MEVAKDKDYYESRLRTVAMLYWQGDMFSLACGKEIIENVLSEYMKFPDFDSTFASAIRKFVLEDLKN